jgi:hypothetical protein
MLKAAPYPAQCFLADAEVRSNMPQGYSFQYMWRLQQQAFISFCGSFKLCIYKPLFQPDIIFFISNSYQPFYFMVLIK